MILNAQVVKNIIDTYDDFLRNSSALMGQIACACEIDMAEECSSSL